MTLQWLDELGVRYEADEEYSHFEVPGGQSYPAFTREIPGDFSSATFFLVAAAVTGSRLTLTRLDMADVQGDKAVVAMLAEMGCSVSKDCRSVTIEGPDRLQGVTLDLNATPDALPAMAVAGAVADGTTRLVNVPQAREKETDRIAVMAAELDKMGAKVEELPDGLVIHGGRLRGAVLDGHGDHRVVMALAVAGLVAEGATTVGSAESVSVTFPEFCRLLRHAGGDVCVEE
jgi:3-phosphoshikimate 1-carboxyvinyltransferase